MSMASSACNSSPSPRPNAQIPEHFARRIMPRGARDPAAGMAAGTAQIQAKQWHAVIAMPQDRAGREQLIQFQPSMHDIAAGQAEDALQIERRQNLARDHRGGKPRRMAL